ncbi:MAG: hypothetical protein LBP82_04070, partial [Candidatus Methanoplasma sp.]|nr:hypothetical protein [Candidatus Methanoplasma sp.]
MKKKFPFLAVFAVTMFLAVSFGVVTSNSIEHERGGVQGADFTGYIPISTPQELARIGTTAYPLNGKYYLTNDIDFTGIDINGGVDIDITATVTGTDLAITLTPHSGSVSLVYAWIGSLYTFSTDTNTVTLATIPQGEYALIVSGRVGTTPFAYSTMIDTTGDGVKINNIRFSSNGNFTPIGGTNGAFKGTFD